MLKTPNLLLLLCGMLLLSCSKSNDQRRFEDQALTPPQNISEYTANGQPVQNRNDPDDWRIGPMFRSLVTIQTPAHPNPVNFNSSFAIDIDIRGFESINGLQIFAFQDPNRPIGPLFVSEQSQLPPGVTTVILEPTQFAQSASGDTVFRILIYDNQQNLISYGDIEVI